MAAMVAPHRPLAADRPLTALLSYALVAFTEAPKSSGSRFRQITLSEAGRRIRDELPQRFQQIEENCRAKFGADTIRNLRCHIEQLTGDGTAQSSPLFAGLEPYPEGRRAKVPRPKTLPDFPMVLHRDGYPDGS